MINIKIDDSAVKRAFADMEKQIRFAAAQALTNTVKDAQAEVRRQLPQRFTIRTGWIAKGIQIRTASKSNLTATILVKDAFMALQETGGNKVSTSGKAMGVPVGARPNPRAVTRPSVYPRRLLDKQGYFIAPIISKSITARSSNLKNVRRRIHNKAITLSDVGKMALWRRRGRKRLPIDLLYVFEHSVPIKPRFKFFETVRKVARENLPKRFGEALRKVLETAR